jgi:hypothetical protein
VAEGICHNVVIVWGSPLERLLKGVPSNGGSLRRNPLVRVWIMLLGAHKALPLLARMVRRLVREMMPVGRYN